MLEELILRHFHRPKVSDPNLYHCTKCGAGLSRQRLFTGGIFNHIKQVKFQLQCSECGTFHTLKGDNSYNRYIFCTVAKKERKRQS